MAIVSQDYYNTTYFGEPVAASDFPRLEARAEELVQSITKYQFNDIVTKLTDNGHTALATQITDLFKRAICAQVEYYVSNGVLSVNAGDSGTGFTVGKVRVDGETKSFSNREMALVSPAASMYLAQTGLLGRGIPVAGEPFAPFPWGVF